MSNGAPPLPEQKPPGPEEPTLPEGGGPGGEDERKEEKCRKTQIKRVYADDGKHWVDVEQLTQGSFSGAQWLGPEDGNQTQETILNLAPGKLDGGEGCGDQIEAGMNPSNPIVGNPSGSGEGKGPQIATKVPSRKSSYVESRNNIRRKFATKKKPECCKDMKRRVQFNNIEEKYLKADIPTPPSRPPGAGGGGGQEGERPPTTSPPAPDQPTAQLRSFLRTNGNGVPRSLSAAASSGGSSGGGSSSGGSGGKVPPKEPKEYKKAVRKSNDSSEMYLDICITKDSKMMKTGKRQEIRPKKIWKDGRVDLPPAWLMEQERRYAEEQERLKKAAEEKTKADAEKGPTGGGGGGGGGDKPEKEDTSKAGKLTPAPKGPFFKLDPYQVPINFGPDALAVEFYDGAGPAIEESQKMPP
jgi:hypothetical protein